MWCSFRSAGFNWLPTGDVTTWTVLISGYAEYGWYNEVLECFERMQDKGFIPDATTYASALKACGIGLMTKGEKIHAEVKTHGLLEDNAVLGTALVDMYAKCGAMEKAQDVFYGLLVHNTVSWTALIAGFAQVGYFERVCTLFKQMILEDFVPNEVTFVVLLSVCSHRGLVEESEVYFETMNIVYSLTPAVEHYVCMVDLYSRAGIFDKALSVIKKVPFSDCRPLWSALLAGCQKWLNVDLGKLAFEHIMKLDESYASAYISMSNIYIDGESPGEGPPRRDFHLQRQLRAILLEESSI